MLVKSRRRLSSLVRRLAAWIDIPAQHPLSDYVKAGDIHPSVIFANAICDSLPGACIRIGEDSVLNAHLIFHRPATFCMGARSYVGARTSLHIAESISIGDDVMISWGCTLIDTDMHSLAFSKRARDVLIAGHRNGLRSQDKDWTAVQSAPIRIQDKVWVGFQAIILKGVTLAEGCVVGAGSVVTTDVPAWTLVAGNPARVIRRLDPDE